MNVIVIHREGAREEAEADRLRGRPGEAAQGEQGEVGAAEAGPRDAGRSLPARKGDLHRSKTSIQNIFVTVTQ